MHLSLSLAVLELIAVVVYAEAVDHPQWRRPQWKRDAPVNSTQSLSIVSSQTSNTGLPSISSPPFPADSPQSLPSGSLGSLIAAPLGTAPGSEAGSSSIIPSSTSDYKSAPSNVTSLSAVPIVGILSNATASRTTSEEPSSSSSLVLFPTANSTSNATATTSGDFPTITPPPLFANGTGLNITGSVGYGSSGIGSLGTGGCVVNVQAGVDWWFSENIYQAIASISTITLNGSVQQSYTLVPVSTVDVDDQLATLGETFVFTEYFDPTTNQTVDDYVFITPPPPIAASTSTVTISDVNPLPSDSVFGIDQLNTMNNIDPYTPSIAIPTAEPTPINATQYDNIAYYTAYEVEFDALTIDDSGDLVTITSTSTFSLDEPFAYTLDPSITFGDAAVATGDVNTDFFSYIPYSTCQPGTWTAAPVMIVVVEITYQRGFAIFLVHQEATDTGGLDVPTNTAAATSATVATVATGGGGGAGSGSGVDTSVHVVPAVAHVESSDVTFFVAVTGNPASVTVPVGPSSVVASVVGGGTTAASAGAGGGGGIASAIVQALGGGSSANSGSGATAAGGGSSAVQSVNGVGFASAATGSTGSSGSGSGSGAGSGSSGSGSSAAAGGVAVLTIAGETFVGNQATQFQLAPGVTLTAGGVATLGSNTVSLASNGATLVVNGQTTELAVPATTPAPALVIAGSTVTANAGGTFVVSGQDLTQGGQITVGSNTISLASGGSTIVVNGVSITAPAVLATATPVLAIDGTTFSAENGGESFVIAGQTLAPGEVITVNGNTISLGSGSNPSIAVVNGQTVALSSILLPASINVGGSSFAELPGGSFVVDGTTLQPGQQIVIAGTTLSLASNDGFIVINGVTSQIALGTVPVLVIGGSTYGATSGISGAYVIGGQTLSLGGVITENGHTISLVSLSGGGSALVVDGSTSFLNTPTTTLPPLLTIGGTVYTANSGTTFVIDGLTLTPGGSIVDHGTTISLSPHATAVVINGKTTTLFPATNVPTAASALATSTTKQHVPTGPTATSASATATSTKKGAAPSVLINLGMTCAVTLLTLLGAFCAWI